MFRPVYAPIAVVNDTLYCFNFSEDRLEVYNKNVVRQRMQKLAFHKGRKWEPQIFIDDVLNKVYTLSLRNGISCLNEIDLNTGELVSGYEIPDLPLVEKIGVNNGWVYFLYAERRNVFHKYYRYKHLFKMRLL